MSTIKSYTRNFLTGLIVALQVCAFPLAVYAQEAQPSTDPVSTTQPVSQPVEPAPVPPPPPPAPEPEPAPSPSPAPAPAPAPEPEPNPYVLNPETGNYENDKYIWDPNTFQSTPKTDPAYSYNPLTNAWETPTYAYNPTSQEYAPNIPLTSQTMQTDPNSQLTDPLNSSIVNPNSMYNGDFTNKDPTHFFDGFYNAEISNNIYSNATSGNASVTQNTLAGNALTGNASAMANLINLLQTSFNPGVSGQIGTFVANIDGDVVGDIMIDPGQISNKTLAATNGSTNPDLEINVENNGTITNNINLAANSGNSSVSNNTEAGDATTGTASAIANVVNMINSSVAAGESFFGIININGNFNGDILMPPNALDYLLASSAPRTTVDLASLGDQELTANLTNNQTINNNIQASAESGTATVSNNTQAGSATTGDASTKVTILNLTGSNIIGSNSLLVFVNVMGEWVGLIVDAPAGSTSAAYAGGVTGNNSLPGYDNILLNSTNNSTITNNINVAAKSGDAEVRNNTIAGNATSGDAYAGVNLLNIINSNLSFSDWFGVLFINVLGSWHGSFGVDTAAGNKPSTPGKKPANAPQVVRFVPTNSEMGSSNNGSAGFNNSASQFNLAVYPASFYGDVDITNDDENQTVVLASADKSSIPPSDESASSSAASSGIIDWGIASASLLILLLAIGAERMIASRRQAELVTQKLLIK